MAQNPQEVSAEHHKKWHQATEGFAIVSEICNAGIVIGIVALFYPSIMMIGAFAFLSHYMDALIYVFKALIRATKALGRHCFKIKFEEDVEQHSTTQTTLDLIALLFFIGTIVLLTAVANPLAPTIAWILAWVGLGLVGYSDYYLSKVHAKENLDTSYQVLLECIKNYKNNPTDDSNKDALSTAENNFLKNYQTFEIKNKSFKLYGMLMIGIGALLICSSAAAITTGTAFIILSVIAKIASAYLGLIAIFRFLNYLKSKSDKTPEIKTSLSNLIIDVSPNDDAQKILEAYINNHKMNLELRPINSDKQDKRVHKLTTHSYNLQPGSS